MAFTLSNITTVGRLIMSTNTPVSPGDEFFSDVSILMKTSNINGASNKQFIDSSSNNLTISTERSPFQGSFNPFGVTEYSPELSGGSIVGNIYGTSFGFLNIPNVNDGQTFPGSFTIECWVRRTAISSLESIVSVGTYNNGVLVRLPTVYVNGSTLSGPDYSPPLNQWVHIAVVRNADGLVALFAEGIRRQTATITGTVNSGRNPTFLPASQHSPGEQFPGYISNFSIVKGESLYDPTIATYTVPTSPKSATENTTVLINGTNAGVFDATSKRNLVLYDTGTLVSTSLSKFNQGSVNFGGIGSYISSYHSPDLVLGSGDFTIETWLNLVNTTDTKSIFSFSNNYELGVYINQATPCLFASSNGSTWNLISGNLTGGADGQGIPAFTANTWAHFALVRNGNVWSMYVNGVLNKSVTVAGSIYTRSSGFDIGRGVNGENFFKGNIEDFRFTKGVARYTANFVPPTAPFPEQ